MSAFIVDSKTLDNVVAALCRASLCNEMIAPSVRRELHAMNVAAYGERYAKQDGIAYEESRGEATHALVQQIKSVRCFLYQCTEGDVPKSKRFAGLYAACERAASYLSIEYVDRHKIALKVKEGNTLADEAQSYVMSTDEYESAEWG